MLPYGCTLRHIGAMGDKPEFQRRDGRKRPLAAAHPFFLAGIPDRLAC